MDGEDAREEKEDEKEHIWRLVFKPGEGGVHVCVHALGPLFFFFFLIIYLYIFFLLYSMMTQLHMHVYILFIHK